MSKDNQSVAGYQMSCLREGHVNCNKSLSNNVSGSDETSVRMLKAWVLQGRFVSDKASHKKLWERINTWKADGSLPSLDSLDAQLSGQNSGAEGSAPSRRALERLVVS